MKTLWWWYLSFVGPEGFRGACVVRGADIADAALEAHRLGVNPGGEVMGFGPMELENVPPWTHRNRLMSKEVIREIWPGAKAMWEHNNEDERLH